MKLENLYIEMHKQPGMFLGHSLEKHKDKIATYLNNHELETLLDYGCGKGVSWQGNSGLELCDMFGVRDVRLYDPGVPRFSKKVRGNFDAVICIDVLEHIPEDELDDVLKEIFQRAKKVVVVSFCTRAAKKVLPNGLNVHVTIKPYDWWVEKLEKAHQKINKDVSLYYFENP